MIKMNFVRFNQYLAQGRAINAQGQRLIVLESGDLEPVKIIGTVNYKGEKPNSFSPVKVQGLKD